MIEWVKASLPIFAACSASRASLRLASSKPSVGRARHAIWSASIRLALRAFAAATTFLASLGFIFRIERDTMIIIG